MSSSFSGRRPFAGVLWLMLAIAVFLFGQSFTASVRGVITDSSEAAVPGAKITITDVDRNTERTGQTDAMGRYVITAIPPGTYTLAVEAAGFQKTTHAAFTLQVQQQATIDMQLQVGQVSTSVNVEAAAPLLNTTIANLGQVIENRYINQLPLINRNVFALTYLTPGVVGAAGAYNASESTNFVAVGTRNSTADVMLDGVTITTPEQNSGITTAAQTPAVDAVEEFKVQTSFFSAEFGNTGGAVVNMVTKSGTNQYHGSGYWFYRHDSLNANSFFSNRAGKLKPSYHRHLYGGTVGGPIKENKTSVALVGRSPGSRRTPRPASDHVRRRSKVITWFYCAQLSSSVFPHLRLRLRFARPKAGPTQPSARRNGP